MSQDTLDFNPAPQVVHCPCCPTQKANRRAINANVVRIGRRSPETSQKAAQGAFLRSGTKRARIYELIKQAGQRGLCDHEIEHLTGWSHQTASSTRNSLMNDGWIFDSGIRRKTPAGNGAIAWQVLK
jgi:hypothetical protein